jgi:hypothetical protein
MIFRGSVEGSMSAKKGRLTMNRIRLAFSIVSLTAVLTFGLTLTSRIARADQRIPECNCYTSPPILIQACRATLMDSSTLSVNIVVLTSAYSSLNKLL